MMDADLEPPTAGQVQHLAAVGTAAKELLDAANAAARAAYEGAQARLQHNADVTFSAAQAHRAAEQRAHSALDTYINLVVEGMVPDHA